MRYVVQRGDTMFRIAQRYNIPLTTLIQANPQITDPGLIYPGQVIVVPVRDTTLSYHIIQRGDTLYSIARQYDIPLEDIIEANPQIPNPSLIYPGQFVLLPFGTGELAGCLAVLAGTAGERETISWLSPVTGVRQDLITSDFGQIQLPEAKWSPGGDYIAYNAQGLWLVDNCGRQPRQLAQGDIDHFNWSPSGEFIAFDRGFSTYVVSITGTERKIADNFYWPDWISRDRLVGIGTIGAPPTMLATISVDGINRRALNVPADGYVTVSPLRDRVAFTRVSTSPSSRVSIVYIYGLTTGAVTSLPQRPIRIGDVTYSLAINPTWSQRGKFVLYKVLTGRSLAPGALSYSLALATRDGEFIRDLDRVQETSPFAWGPFSDWISYGRDSSLVLRRITTGDAKQYLWTGDVSSLDWSSADCPDCRG